MASAHTDLVLSANHAQRLLAAHLRALDGKFLVAVIELGAQCGDNHLLSSGNIGGAAHNLYGCLAIAQVDGGDVQVVTVGVVNAGNDVAHDQAAQSATNCLDTLQCAHFQSQTGQCYAHLLGGKVSVDVVS